MALQLGGQEKRIYTDDDDDEHEAYPALTVVLGCDEDRYQEHHEREQVEYHPCAYLRDFHALIRTVVSLFY